MISALLTGRCPYIDGLETIRRIRAGAASRKPAAVLMTAYDTAEIQEESRQAGACAIITKPLFESALTVLLAENFRRRERNGGRKRTADGGFQRQEISGCGGQRN